MSENGVLDLSLSDIRGPMKTLLDNLCGPNGFEILAQLNRFNRKEPCWTAASRPPFAKPKILGGILEEVGDPIRLPAVPRFVAAEKFVLNVDSEVPICYLGTNFKTNLLGIVELGVRPMTVRRRKLLDSSSSRAIAAALGDKDVTRIRRANVALAHVYEFLKTSDRFEWYIFFVGGWAVDAYWDADGDGWDVGASSVTDPRTWDGGRQVISR